MMWFAPTRRLAVFLLLAVFALGLGGCWNPFAPEGGDQVPVEPADYHERLSPEDVLHNLRTAYLWKNPDRYIECLAEDFIFFTAEADQDPTNEDPLEPYWYRVDEEQLHRSMFSSPMVEEITLTLTHISVDSLLAPDGSGDMWYEYYEDVNLSLTQVDEWKFIATLPSLFYFRRVEGQTAENGHPLWEIIEWHDNPYNVQPKTGGADGEIVSLGQLKAMFGH
jgi:hypothetical protein